VQLKCLISIFSAGGATMSKIDARAWYALGVLVLATLFAFVDRQILVVIVEPLKHDLALRDVQIGALQGFAFAVFSVVAAIPLAWLADRFERSRVLSFACCSGCSDRSLRFRAKLRRAVRRYGGRRDRRSRTGSDCLFAHPGLISRT
jgi:hypothetical protein